MLSQPRRTCRATPSALSRRINDSQKAAWCRTIDVLQTDSSAKQMALFPTDRQAPTELEAWMRTEHTRLSRHAPVAKAMDYTRLLHKSWHVIVTRTPTFRVANALQNSPCSIRPCHDCPPIASVAYPHQR